MKRLRLRGALSTSVEHSLLSSDKAKTEVITADPYVTLAVKPGT